MTSRSDTSRDRRPIRWWPAVVILVIEVGLLAFFWLRPEPSMQHRVIPTFPTLFFGTLALFIWLVFFSRLPGRVRVAVFLAAAAITGAGFLLLEIQGVDGNLVPILGWRWAAERRFAEAEGAMAPLDTGVAGVTAPGPEDYPQFYGPRRDATLPGPRLARDWSAQPPRELWRREVGEGWSSFAVASDAAVTQEQRGEDEVVVRYELRTGRQVWTHAVHAPFDTTVGGRGPRATPTIADDRVFNLGATGLLRCLRLADGELVWSRDVLADHGAGQPPWGMASSPLVVGERVVVQLGRSGAGLAAYDCVTGEPAWRVGEDGGTYSSPILAELAGREQILIVDRGSVAGHEPRSGAVLWRADWPNPGGGERITPPLLLDDERLLVSAGYGVGSRLFRIVPEGEGFAIEQLWDSPRLKSKFAPMVLHEGVVYGLDDGVMVALDLATGERLWKRGRHGHGQMILVGELILLTTEKGEVVLIDPDPGELRELGRFTAFDSKTWNPPALAGRLLLVRNNRQAAAYELPLAD